MTKQKGNPLVTVIKKTVGLPTGGASSCCGAAPGVAPQAGAGSCCGTAPTHATPAESGSCCGGSASSRENSGSCCG